MIFVSVHIPKTAGTSLAHVFDHATDRRVMFDYSSDYSNTRFSPTEAILFAAAIPFITQKFNFIHGHFYIDKYVPLLPSCKTTTCFRDPVERIISQYKHVWFEANAASEQYRQMKAGMDVVGFAADSNICNAHRVHLCDQPPENLDFIFLNDRIDEGLKLFVKQFPDALINKWPVAPTLNTGEGRQKKARTDDIEISAAQKDELARLAKDEIEYYKKARSAYHEKKLKILELTDG